MVDYERIYHITADGGVRVYAKTKEEALCKLILATFLEMTDVERTKDYEVMDFEVKEELPFCVADLLNELLALFETKSLVPKACLKVKVERDYLYVKLKMGKFSQENERRLLIKAITYHQLKFEREGENFIAQVIFDL